MNFVSTLYFNRTFVIDSETAISSWQIKCSIFSNMQLNFICTKCNSFIKPSYNLINIISLSIMIIAVISHLFSGPCLEFCICHRTCCYFYGPLIIIMIIDMCKCKAAIYFNGKVIREEQVLSLNTGTILLPSFCITLYDFTSVPQNFNVVNVQIYSS